MPLINDIFNEIEENERLSKISLESSESKRLVEQLIALEERKEADINRLTSVLENISALETMRAEIVDKADQLDFVSAEETLNKAIPVARDILSTEGFKNETQLGYLDKVNTKNHAMIRTFSAEAINVLDMALRVGKAIVKKIVDFILYIFRVIKTVISKILSKIGIKSKVTVTVKKNNQIIYQNDDSKGKDLDSELVAALKNAVGAVPDDAIYDTVSESELNIVDPLSVKIPESNIRSLWNYDKNDISDNVNDFVKGVNKTRSIALPVIKDLFGGLCKVASEDYYNICMAIYGGRTSSVPPLFKRKVMSRKGKEKLDAVDETINELFHDAIKIPRSIDGDTLYPGIMIKTPKRNKELSIKNTIKVMESDNKRMAVRGMGKDFTFRSPGEFVYFLKEVITFQNELLDLSDYCTRVMESTGERLEKLVTVASSPDGDKNFRNFHYGYTFVNNTANSVVNIHNTEILNTLSELSKAQSRVVVCLRDLTSGFDSNSESKGVIAKAIDEYETRGIYITPK